MLEHTAVWDLIYEHYAYWSKGALERLLAASGFRIVSLHQFILGGTVWRLRLRDAAGARTVMGPFDVPVVRNPRLSWRWAPVRLILRATLRAVPSR